MAPHFILEAEEEGESAIKEWERCKLHSGCWEIARYNKSIQNYPKLKRVSRVTYKDDEIVIKGKMFSFKILLPIYNISEDTVTVSFFFFLRELLLLGKEWQRFYHFVPNSSGQKNSQQQDYYVFMLLTNSYFQETICLFLYAEATAEQNLAKVCRCGCL